MHDESCAARSSCTSPSRRNCGVAPSRRNCGVALRALQKNLWCASCSTPAQQLGSQTVACPSSISVSACQDIFAVWGQARSKSRPLSCTIGSAPASAIPYFMVSQETRPEVKAGPSPARSDPRQPQPSLTLWYRRRRLVGLRWGTGSRRARSCGPSFPVGKLLISAEPVEVEIERTEELISRQQALNNLKLHRLGVIGTLGVPVHVARSSIFNHRVLL